MPTAAELPANRVGWKCDPDRAVLLVHDMQNHFVRAFPAGASPLTELIEGIRSLIARCRELGVPVVYSAQPGGQTPQQRGLQLDMWGAGVGSAEGDAAIVDDLAPLPGDTKLTKWRYNAFHRTELAGLLDAWGRDQLVVTGIYAHIGCLMTATDAFMRDIEAFLVADATADFSREEHDLALRYAAGRCARVVTVDEMLAELPRG
ncbi:isochorismatase family protein [Amycolatopsis pithecellobii]|uniref:Isochorismatase family protein n=1 Tax=Amycolatopsis pithecellobii TaxID=664692 RepID=A0A6N7Z5H5_9PSEU|nr:isochorismatase family protein [Amycolatopsis pithecellobii]